MASFNRVIIAGNLTRDVEVRYLPSGQAVAEVSLAVNEKWTSKEGEKKEVCNFIDCTLWGKTAELAGQYLAKGSSVLFEGKLKQDTWEDKESGQKRSKLKVTVDHMQFLGGGKGGEAGQQGAGRTQSAPEAPADYSQFDADDNTPF